MYHHNFTQHVGCGHISETHLQPWTLCTDAEKRLSERLGQAMQPSPPQGSTYVQRNASSSSSGLRQRLKVRLLLSPTSNTPSSYASPTSTPSLASLHGLPMHEIQAITCMKSVQRTHTSAGAKMDVCGECKVWMSAMWSMLERYDKTGCIKGTRAYDEFLRDKAEVEGRGV
jgi:hypothetical protein